ARLAGAPRPGPAGDRTPLPADAMRFRPARTRSQGPAAPPPTPGAPAVPLRRRKGLGRFGLDPRRLLPRYPPLGRLARQRALRGGAPSRPSPLARGLAPSARSPAGRPRRTADRQSVV